MIPDAKLRELIALGEKAIDRPWARDPLSGGIVVGGDPRLNAMSWYRIFDRPRRGDTFGKDGHNDLYVVASANLAVPLAEEVMRLRRVAKCAREIRDGLQMGHTFDLLNRSGLDAALEALRAE